MFIGKTGKYHNINLPNKSNNPIKLLLYDIKLSNQRVVYIVLYKLLLYVRDFISLSLPQLKQVA